MGDCPTDNCPSRQRTQPVWRHWKHSAKFLKRFRSKIIVGDQMDEFSIKAEDCAELAFTQPYGAFGDGIEYRLHVSRRAANGTKDFGGRRLLFQGLGQLTRPRFHFLLQVGVRLLKLRGHAVELIGESLKFVTCSDLDTSIQGPGPDLGRADLQCLDRADHVSCEQQAGNHSQTEPKDR
jgi:hypothetical protein